MPALDGIMFVGMDVPDKPADTPSQQESFAAAPVEFNSSGDVTAKSIIMTLLFFYAIVYVVVLFERKFRT